MNPVVHVLERKYPSWISGGSQVSAAVWMTRDDVGKSMYVATADGDVWYILDNEASSLNNHWWDRISRNNPWPTDIDDHRIAGPFYNVEAAMAAYNIIRASGGV